MLVLEFGGAAGTLATIKDGRDLKCQAALAQKLRLILRGIQNYRRDWQLITGTWFKFSTDVKLMQTEIGEVSTILSTSRLLLCYRNTIPSPAFISLPWVRLSVSSAELYDAIICTLNAALLHTCELITGLRML
ncbi:uncharacterized protein EDB93DRAFT_273466 [Suillus bovinus]|uniref:uncharacterized protein n=1 Tax=Suillus bovinus TaxID=48563 RepID=UPI001B85FF23|nr:uncharacterized protein EDB93DRAFT_273466 [Suillus bovinus]KAG2159226.1 hypothetical protein EDB93DRAFT_273466 [Suillus bovinus]